MEKLKILVFHTLLYSSLIALLVLLSVSPPATAQEAEDEREFNYDADSESGPDHWGEIHPEWHLCNNGTMQSPIDMLNERVEVVSHLGRLRREYKPANATLVNRGHDISLKWEGDAGHIEINGTEYDLKQIHWHSPSEHSINGRRFNLELHLVHESKTHKIAVVGIMYKIGRPDPFLSMLKKHLKAVADVEDEKSAVGIVSPREIKIGSRKYFRYIGSLTVPPCTQNVVWTMVRKVRTVSREQVKLLRDAVHDEHETNARPSQPMNFRKLQLYRPQEKED